jgi:hypothetical protein
MRNGMNKFRAWLKNANGWRRLWFVLSVFGLFFAVVINPFNENSRGYSSRLEFRLKVEEDLQNPECRDYYTKPLNQLVEPPFLDEDGNERCWHLFTHRKFDDPTTVPYTLADLKRNFTKEERNNLLVLSAFGFVVTAILSALVYWLGLVVAWVIGGFKKQSV